MTGEEETRMRAVEPIGTRRQGRAPLVVVVLTVLAQGAVLFLTFVAGLQWDGWTYAAALLQALLLGGVLTVLGSRRSWLILAVPLTSAAISLGLLLLFVEAEDDAACNDREMAAVAGLRSPSGEPLKFVGTYDGCSASVPTEQVTEQATKGFAATLRAHGWTVDNPDGGRMAHKGRVVIFVEPLTESGTGMSISLADDNW